MSYWVLYRPPATVIGVTTQNPYNFNLPDVYISAFDGPVPDLNQYVWDFDNSEFVKSGNIYSRREFLSRFTIQERSSIRASSDPIVLDIMNMLELAEYVSVVDPTTIQSVQYLAAIGLIGSNRVAEILE